MHEEIYAEQGDMKFLKIMSYSVRSIFPLENIAQN